MKIINLKQKYLFTYSFQDISSSFILKIGQLGQIWLFNCTEGCQYILARKKIKISQISKIIITDLRVQNISGLLGLLSSLSLNSSIKNIDLYGPEGLSNYLFLGRKYSQTNFRYIVSIYSIQTGIIVQNKFFQIYAFNMLKYFSLFNYSILMPERPGPLDILKVRSYKIPLGPLYGNLKLGKDFILPDGVVIFGNNFVNSYYLGNKLTFLSYLDERQLLEIGKYGFLISY
uniref:Uncharacterized protein n=1 Tax=Synarthrophyton chejuense TaxID=2485825 RepID=A0A3G3MFQ2_9FLOR|nr:hypothetical protein [Synarthrophyton chejuense]AYR05648.1 hypothetical protein [Synarthrophyton chejuense]